MPNKRCKDSLVTRRQLVGVTKEDTIIMEKSKWNKLGENCVVTREDDDFP